MLLVDAAVFLLLCAAALFLGVVGLALYRQLTEQPKEKSDETQGPK